MKFTNLSKPTALILILAITLLSSYFLLIGSGMFPEPDFGQILLTSVLIIFLSSSKKGFYFLLLPLAIIHAIYTPTGLNFGAPSYQYIASIFATDLLETKEFLQQMPISSYLIAFTIPLLIWLQYKIRVNAGIQFQRNRTFVVLSGLLFAYYLPIAEPLKQAVDSAVKITKETHTLKEMAKANNWGSSTLENSKYDDYVIVLGESARKDYHHAYGYPVENTPFMSSANGTLIDGMTSAGTNTIASLRLMLTLPNKESWEPHYQLQRL